MFIILKINSRSDHGKRSKHERSLLNERKKNNIIKPLFYDNTSHLTIYIINTKKKQFNGKRVWVKDTLKCILNSKIPKTSFLVFVFCFFFLK